MKADHINSQVDHINSENTIWHRGCTYSPALDVDFTPRHGPKVSRHLKPPLYSEFKIIFETTRVSAARMLHITPDEIEIVLDGRFRTQASDVWSTLPLPRFIRSQQYVEGNLRLTLGRDGTFLIKATLGDKPPARRTSSGDLCVTIKFLGYLDQVEGSHEPH
ncbi:hypothetical protein KYC5002_43700 [Archangium violaceum]|uniref:hypothetical protein n=1 Tax=Archangium violaceum TaxID=83451 RepID=UPI002B2E46ED|nr:hypothetical protein KYC5002_43700 [Archangium gephyra]